METDCKRQRRLMKPRTAELRMEIASRCHGLRRDVRQRSGRWSIFYCTVQAWL